MSHRPTMATVLTLACAVLLGWHQVADAAELSARQVLEASGAQGGLVVQVGCRNRSVMETLGSNGRFLVQALDSDPAAVAEARKALHAAGIYGLVSADELEDAAQLPYAENLVNVLVLEGAAGAKILPAEALRVLCPGGVMIASSWRAGAEALNAAGFQDARLLTGDAEWVVAKKPWPAGMDQWPQPRHGADGNAASNDKLVGPPRRVRWIAGPPQEISNMVSSGGRNFYGGVLARDGFNGLRLWQQKLNPTPARGGFSFGFGRASGPEPIGVGSLFFVYHDGKVRAVDGATGKELRQYPDAGAPTDMLADGGLLLAVDKLAVRAVDIETGSLRWKRDTLEPRCVVAGDGSVYLVEGGKEDRPCVIVGLELRTGEVQWRNETAAWLKGVRNLVYHKGLLACEISTLADKREGNTVEVVSATDGKSVLTRPMIPATSHYQQARAIFIDDLMWVQAKEGWTGHDLRSGEVKHVYPCGTGHCFPPVATGRYLLAGEMHMTDLRTGLVDINPITKGNCSRDAGFMLANGLIYTAPKHCICWPMLRDYTALAPALPETPAKAPAKPAPVFVRKTGTAQAPEQGGANAATDWPMYRHDALRSGSSVVEAPTDMKVRWSRKLGDRPEGPIADDWRDDPYVRGPVSAPVVAGGKVFVSRPDAHQIVVLDEATGEECWRFTAAGRVDTPPTIHQGMCLFGSSSGYVYCLRADDGGLIWRLRIAPVDQRIVVYGQIESPWPVPGSVLVVDDVAYVAAGRQSLADGGIRVVAIQPSTGRVMWNKKLDTVPQTNFYDSSGLEFDNFDLLHVEGKNVTMSRWHFDRQTGHMVCTPKSGFVRMTSGDSSGVVAPRGFWSYAPRNESEQNTERPFVRPPLCFRDNRLFGLSEDRKTLFRRDFDLTGQEDLDQEWFKGWATYAGARKGGDLWRTQRLARAAKWMTAAFPGIEGNHRGGAMAMAANAILIASQQGGLAVLSLEDGGLVGRVDIPPVAWDGIAISAKGVFVSTLDGQVMCLEGK